MEVAPAQLEHVHHPVGPIPELQEGVGPDTGFQLAVDEVGYGDWCRIVSHLTLAQYAHVLRVEFAPGFGLRREIDVGPRGELHRAHSGAAAFENPVVDL